MSYITPKEFSKFLVDAGEDKVHMAVRDVLIRSTMAGALLAIAVVLAVTITVQTGYAILGALLFPVGFSILYLMGFDLLTGVFILTPLALIDKRSGVTAARVLKHWGLVFIGNFTGSVAIAFLTSYVLTYGFSVEPNEVGRSIAVMGENRTLGYKMHGGSGMATIFIRGVLCNWLVALGVVGAFISTTVGGKVLAMWMPIMLFFALGFEHSVVNMFLFPFALMMGGNFSLIDYLLWNEIPVVLGNLIGGLSLTGFTIYATHFRTAPARAV